MIEHLLSHGPAFPISVAVSVIGSFLGLAFASRARRTRGPLRWQWLALAAFSLGAIAVWSMHFIAMMGYSPDGLTVRYDPPLTVISGLLAVAVMAVALGLTLNHDHPLRLLTGGAIAGLGVVSMHYMGMFSMNFRGTMSHETGYVATAIGIALAAATVALWCATRLNGAAALTFASPLMAVAIASMHYTAMMGVRITPDTDWSTTQPLPGGSATEFLLPLIVGLFVTILTASLFLMLSDDIETRRPRGTPGRAAAPPLDRSAPAADDVWTRRR